MMFSKGIFSDCWKTSGCCKGGNALRGQSSHAQRRQSKTGSVWESVKVRIVIDMSHTSLLKWYFFPNGPDRIGIFHSTCLHEAFFIWLVFYSVYLCPCKHSYSLCSRLKATSSAAASSTSPLRAVTSPTSPSNCWESAKSASLQSSRWRPPSLSRYTEP